MPSGAEQAERPGRWAACFVVLFLFLLLPQPATASNSLLLFADRETIVGQQSVAVTFSQPGHYALHDATILAADASAMGQVDSVNPDFNRDRAEEPAVRYAILPVAPRAKSSHHDGTLLRSPEHVLTGRTEAPWSPPPR